MEFYKNVLSQESLDGVQNFVMQEGAEKIWAVSNFSWGPKLNCYPGTCITANIPTDLFDMIEGELKPYLPEYERVEIMAYAWLQQSQIGTHNDPNVKFGATVYLNPEWHTDWGGLFLHSEEQTDDWDTIKTFTATVPERNMLVVNTKKEVHLVTPISLEAPVPRFSLQIWGH